MKKKKFTIGKIILTIFLLLLIAAAGVVYYLYNMVNNYKDYEDKFVDYETELVQYETSEFKDFIFYDKEAHLFKYEVPRAYLYKIINKDSMRQFLGLPDEIEITDIGVYPDFEKMKIDIYLGIKYQNYVKCGLEIYTNLSLSEDHKRMELRYDDYYLINDKVMEYADKYVNLQKGTLMFTHKFPVFVEYYQMPDYKVEYVSDLSFDGNSIKATYNIEQALIKYKEEEYDKNTLEEKLEAVFLEVLKAGIKH